MFPSFLSHMRKLISPKETKKERGVVYKKRDTNIWIPDTTLETSSLLSSKVLQKAKTAQIGEIREWSGVKMKKTAEGWVPATESKTSTKEDDTTVTDRAKLEEFAKQASTEALEEKAKGDDKILAELAKKELEERNSKSSTNSTTDTTQSITDEYSSVVKQMLEWSDYTPEGVEKLKELQSQQKVLAKKLHDPDYKEEKTSTVSSENSDEFTNRREELNQLSKSFDVLREKLEKGEVNEEVDSRGLDSNDRAILGSYTSDDYSILNKSLRNPPPTKEAEEYNIQLNRTLEKLPKYQGTVHRGVGFKTEEELSNFINSLAEQSNRNKGIIQFATPTSSSQIKRVADSFRSAAPPVVMRIQSKTGRDLLKYSEVENEYEVLFSRDTKFKLKYVDKNYDGSYDIELEEV